MAYWLMKSEPDVFSIDDLKKQKTSLWDGVRNYQARNYLRQMAVGDVAFFYHSSTEPPGIVGLCKVSQAEVVDPSQFNPTSEYHDPTSPPDNPRWWTVKVKFEKKFKQMIELETLRQTFTPEEFLLVRKGSRLSVIPVDDAIAERILALAQ